MAKWLKDYLNFGSKKGPPQPPKPDYTESEILRAYRAQKELDFEDPYEPSNRANNGSGTSDLFPAFGTVLPNGMEVKIISPKHRLIKVESQEFNRCKIPLGIVSFEEPHVPVVPSAPAVGDTDYADPFDARPDPRAHLGWESSSVENSSSYMEPFEAQRVITELQHSSEHGRTVSRASPQLYDSPYEEHGHYNTAFPDDERESRLPQDDERPADEYDQPWEWKKENISKALAVQFDGADWERSTLPHTDLHRRTGGSRTSPPSSKVTSLRKPSDLHTVLGERVDPTLPLDQQVWYHGALTRSEAESLLTLCKECSYLVRNSQTSRNDYSLSLRHSVYWLDELPANSKRSTTAFESTARWSQLSEKKKISARYEYDRASPEWKVSAAALKAHPSERVCLLARPRQPAVGWQPDRPILPSFGTGVKSKAKASPRICQLAHPKKTRISQAPSDSSTNRILALSPRVKPSSHIHLLALPKKEHPHYCPDRPVSAHVPKSVLKAIASERLQELATPKPRKPLFEGFDPYKVSPAARAATASPRIQELSLPPARKCRAKSAQDEHKNKHM